MMITCEPTSGTDTEEKSDTNIVSLHGTSTSTQSNPSHVHVEQDCVPGKTAIKDEKLHSGDKQFDLSSPASKTNSIPRDTLGENFEEEKIKMTDSASVTHDEGVSDDIEDLLCMKVSKDYINCVWTNEPMQRNGVKTEGSSSVKTVKENLTSSLKENSGKCTEAPNSGALENLKKSKKVSKRNISRIEGIKTTSVKKANMKVKSKLPKKTNVIPKIQTELYINKSSKLALPGGSKKRVRNKCNPALKQNTTSIEPPEISQPNDTENAPNDQILIAFKQLVLQPSLPPYAPKDLDERFFSGNYHSCDACGDKFVMETSLLAHIGRKTSTFSYNCSVCKTQLSFHNRCSFLKHIMLHGLDTKVLKAEDLHILPLSIEEDGCEWLFDYTSHSCRKCPECSVMVNSLKKHLEGEDVIDPITTANAVDGALFNCKLCAHVLPTKCAFSAHERWHKGEPPHLCPDCGELFLKASTLFKHMEETCLHDQKRTVFQCGYCKVVIMSIDIFTEHLLSKHLRPIYICHLCGVRLASFEEFNAHRVSNHKLSNVTPLSGTAALCAHAECDECPGVNISVNSLKEHAISHTLDRKSMTSIYQCKKCQAMYASKEHILRHKNGSDCVKGKVSGIIISDVNSSVKRTSNTDFLPSVDPDNVGNDACTKPEVALLVPNTNANEISPGKKTVLPCTEEEKKPSEVEKSLRSQSVIPLVVPPTKPSEAFKKNLVCKICKKVVSDGIDKAALKRHFASNHFDIFMSAIHGGSSNRLPLQVVYTRSLDGGKDKKIVEKFIKSLSFHPGSISKTKTRIMVSKKKNSKVLKARRSPLKTVSGTVQMKTRGFVCYKCPFHSEDSDIFKRHIISHKSNPTDLQCPQCGLCFIVRPPLEKHLIIGHGIKNVNEYLTDNGFKEDHISDADEEISDVDKPCSEELEENQCKVCREKFESQLLLEKHFRVHGGAFLLAFSKRSGQ